MNIDALKKQIAESEGFPLNRIDELVAFISDVPYITGAGLQFKMLATYKAGKFAVQAIMPTAEEYALVRRMMGLKDEDPLVIMRGEVWVQGFERPFIDYGTASPKNLKGFVRFSDYPLEMATRRATNRAMRLATATGMCSVDELPDSAGNPHDAGKGEPATQGQKDLLANFCRSHLITEEERATIHAQLPDMDRRTASATIDRMKATLEGRRNGSGQKPENTPDAQNQAQDGQTDGTHPDTPAQGEGDTSGQGIEPATRKQCDAIQRLLDHDLFTAEERQKGEDFLAGDKLNKKTAGAFIGRLKKRIEDAEGK